MLRLNNLKSKFFIFLFLFLVSLFSFSQAESIVFFWGDGCPHCVNQKEYFQELEGEYDEFDIDEDVKMYEVYYNQDNQKLMRDYSKKLDTELSGVPTVIYGSEYFVGANKNKTREFIEKQIQQQDNDNKLVQSENGNIESLNEDNEIVNEQNETNLEGTKSNTEKVYEIGDTKQIDRLSQGLQTAQYGISKNWDQLQELNQLDLDISNMDIDLEKWDIVYASLGQRNTGGYGIDFDVRYNKTKDHISIDYKETSPGSNEMVTQAITYPTKIIAVYNDKNVPIVFDEDNSQVDKDNQNFEINTGSIDQYEKSKIYFDCEEGQKAHIDFFIYQGDEDKDSYADIYIEDSDKEFRIYERLNDNIDFVSKDGDVQLKVDKDMAISVIQDDETIINNCIGDKDSLVKGDGDNLDDQGDENRKVVENTVIFFHGQGCPACQAQQKYLDVLKKEYDFEIEKYEIFYSKENQSKYQDYQDKLGTTFEAVPVLIIGDEHLVGASYDQTKKLLEQNLKPKEDVETTVFGYEISLNSMGPFVFGGLLGLADGINPCVLGVLVFLLTYLLSTGSKKKILYSGIIFTVVTFLLYASVMYLIHIAMMSAMDIIPHISMFQKGIGILAVVLGLLEIKDLFWYGKGISLRIPKAVKPVLENLTRRGTYVSVGVLALLAGLVELPCTIGIPLVYLGAIEDSVNIFVALGVYNMFYIVPLVLVISSVYMGYGVAEKTNIIHKITDTKYKKYMRALAGIILLVVGVLFIIGVF